MVSGPVRLRLVANSDNGAHRTGELLAAARGVELDPWPQDQRTRLYRSISHRIAAARRARSNAFALAAAGCACAVALLVSNPSIVLDGIALLTPRGAPAASSITPGSDPVSSSHTALAAPIRPGREWKFIQLGDVGMLETPERISVDVRELDNERQLHIEGGTLRAQVSHQDPARPIVVVTPHFRVVVVGTRLDVSVDGDVSSVVVLEGRVRVEASGRQVYVGAGESIRSDDARLQPPAYSSSMRGAGSSLSLGDDSAPVPPAHPRPATAVQRRVTRPALAAAPHAQ